LASAASASRPILQRTFSQEIGNLSFAKLPHRLGVAIVFQQSNDIVGKHIGVRIGSAHREREREKERSAWTA
jgi:hypothetical protein